MILLRKFFAGTAFLFIVACNNQKKEETKVVPSTPEKKAEAAKKTEISVGPDGGELKTKDANIKINTKDTTRH